jgi:hypothetical protein
MEIRRKEQCFPEAKKRQGYFLVGCNKLGSDTSERVGEPSLCLSGLIELKNGNFGNNI